MLDSLRYSNSTISHFFIFFIQLSSIFLQFVKSIYRFFDHLDCQPARFQCIDHLLTTMAVNWSQNSINSEKTLKMKTIQRLRVRLLFTHWKYTLCVFIFDRFGSTTWTVHSGNTTRFWPIGNSWFFISLTLYIFLRRFYRFWCLWFLTTQTATFRVTIHSAIVLLRLGIFIVLGIHLDFSEDITGILQIFNNSIHRFFAHTQLPFRIFDKNLHNFNRMFLFENL